MAVAKKKKFVKEIMTKGTKAKALITCGPKHKVADAMKLMVTNKVSGLPVVDDAGKVVGVITEADVMTARKTSTVKSAMTADPIAVCADATIKEACDLLLEKKIKRALVIKDDGTLWGVVSRTDIIKSMLV